MINLTRDVARSVWQLLILAAIMLVGYACIEMFQFASGVLNLIFVCAYLVVPFFAIRPTRRLRQPFMALGYLLLVPVLLLSTMNLSLSVLDELDPSLKRTEPLQTIQEDKSTIELGRYEHGGAVGVRGVYLKQRRLVVPGLYMMRSIDFFADASGATLSVEGPYTVKVRARGNYQSNDFRVDRIYSLKPWLYF